MTSSNSAARPGCRVVEGSMQSKVLLYHVVDGHATVSEQLLLEDCPDGQKFKRATNVLPSHRKQGLCLPMYAADREIGRQERTYITSVGDTQKGEFD